MKDEEAIEDALDFLERIATSAERTATALEQSAEAATRLAKAMERFTEFENEKRL